MGNSESSKTTEITITETITYSTPNSDYESSIGDRFEDDFLNYLEHWIKRDK